MGRRQRFIFRSIRGKLIEFMKKERKRLSLKSLNSIWLKIMLGFCPRNPSNSPKEEEILPQTKHYFKLKIRSSLPGFKSLQIVAEGKAFDCSLLLCYEFSISCLVTAPQFYLSKYENRQLGLNNHEISYANSLAHLIYIAFSQGFLLLQ